MLSYHFKQHFNWYTELAFVFIYLLAWQDKQLD